MDMLMLGNVRNIMAEVFDEAIDDGIELTLEQAYAVAVKRYEENQND